MVHMHGLLDLHLMIAVVVLVEKGGTGGYTAEVAKQIIAEYFGMNANSVTENMQAISSSESVR